MVWLSLIKESLAALWANRLRSALTIIGMIMGVTSVIAIVSTVEGMQKNIENALSAFGPRSFLVTRIGMNLSMNEYLERLKRKKLTVELIPIIEDGCPDCEAVGAEAYRSDHLKYKTERVRWADIEGWMPNQLIINQREITEGRFFSWQDYERKKNYIVIGTKYKEKLFDTENPIGKKVKLGNNEFTVIGILNEIGESDIVSGIDELVVMPMSTLQKLYPRPGNPVNLVVSAKTLEVRDRAMDQVRVTLRSLRKIPYSDKDDFDFITSEGIMTLVNDITRGFRIVFISLPVLSIVVGGIVIMNIMMISVTERTREIGIRKSIGAKQRNILVQFLYEAVILSLIGGTLGIGGGIYMGGVLLELMFEITMTPTTLGIILGFGISTGVGLFFGIYPALKAARLDPIKALSYE